MVLNDLCTRYRDTTDGFGADRMIHRVGVHDRLTTTSLKPSYPEYTPTTATDSL
jgi:hypothetical protein